MATAVRVAAVVLLAVGVVVFGVAVAGQDDGDRAAPAAPSCQPVSLALADELLRNTDTGEVYVPGARVVRAAAVAFREPIRGIQFWAIAIDAGVGTAVLFKPGPSPDSETTGPWMSADEASETLVNFTPPDPARQAPTLRRAGSAEAAEAARACLR